MTDEILTISSRDVHHYTGFTHKQQRSRIKRKAWESLNDESASIVRPSEIKYLEDHHAQLLDHRMFYKPIWHMLILLLSMVSAALIGGSVYFGSNAFFDSSIIAGILALGSAIGSGILTLQILAKGIFPTLRHSIYSGRINEFVQNLRPTPIGILLDEVDRFNESAEDLQKKLKMVNTLETAGHDMSHVDLEEMVEIYKKTREDLVRALKTERVFRENPGQNLEDFPISFQTFSTGEYDNRAQEFQSLLNRANEVGQRVHERMKELAVRTKI